MLQTNGVTKSEVKKFVKKQFEKTPKRRDDEKTRTMQMIGLLRQILT